MRKTYCFLLVAAFTVALVGCAKEEEAPAGGTQAALPGSEAKPGAKPAAAEAGLNPNYTAPAPGSKLDGK